MTALNKILINTTASIVFVQDTGVSIGAFASYNITESEFLLWVASIDVITLITTGTLVVNNGTANLTSSEGIRFLQYPDRLTIQQSNSDVTRVTTELNFIGAVSVVDNGGGKTTVSVNNSAAIEPIFREVTLVMLGGTLPMNIESNLLFEPDPLNDIVAFLKEQII